MLLSLKNIKYLYFLQGVLCISFFYNGKGLLFFDRNFNTYRSTTSLLSSGGDDDISILLYGIVCILSFIFLVLGQASNKYIKWVFFVSSVCQLLSLILIQVGSIWATMFYGFDFFLIITLMAQVYIIVLLTMEYLRKSGGSVA